MSDLFYIFLIASSLTDKMFAAQHFGKCRVLHMFMTLKQHEEEKKKKNMYLLSFPEHRK